MKNFLSSKYLDAVGFFASLLCAIHCAITPVVLAFSALGGLAFLADPSVESTVVAISSIVALLSLVPSFRKHHQLAPLLTAGLGFLFIALGHLVEGLAETTWFEPAMVVIGGGLVAVAHLQNWHWMKRLQEAS